MSRESQQSKKSLCPDDGASYSEIQGRMDREYAESFKSPEAREWVAGLSPEERDRLRGLGLLKPDLCRGGNSQAGQDAAESNHASSTPDMAAEIDGPEDLDPESSVFYGAMGEGLREILRWEICGESDSFCKPLDRETFETIGRRCVSLGWVLRPEIFEGKSLNQMTEDEMAGTRAALSFWVRDLETKWGIQARGSKLASANEKYRDARNESVKRSRTRKAEEKACRLGLLQAVRPAAQPRVCKNGEQASLF